MALTICHTGDWHLGHTLYRRARDHEHAAFLAWLVDQLEERRADALVVAGDVFDTGSPPGSALAMFYGFLAEVRRRMPQLTVVVIAGNHDSPARLAAPDPVLRGLGVWIVGSVPYEGERIAVERLVVPVAREGVVLGRIVAVPFLRGADLPPVPEDPSMDGHALGARAVYDAAISHARAVRGESEPIVVTGHFAAAGARMSRESERLLVGALDGTLPLDVIDRQGVAYVALGHLHLAQDVGAQEVGAQEVGAQEVGAQRAGQGVVRYSGSPIPLSFAERDLEHEVRFVTISAGVSAAPGPHSSIGSASRPTPVEIEAASVRSEGVRVPRTVRLVRIPEAGLLDRAEAIAAIEGFAAAQETDARAWPWVELRVRARSDERDVIEAVEAAAEGRALHLVHVAVERPEADASIDARTTIEARTAASLDVRDVLVARWTAEHGVAPTAEVLDALAEATAEARTRLDQRRTRLVELEVEPRALVRAPGVAACRRELED